MIVVDTNIIAYLYLSAQHGWNCRQLIGKEPEWHAPRIWRSELRNTLTLYVRQGSLTLDEACNFQSDAEAQMAGREHEISSREVLRLASTSARSAYDCEFIALAEQLGVRLVTEDRQLLKSFPNVAISLADAIA